MDIETLFVLNMCVGVFAGAIMSIYCICRELKEQRQEDSYLENLEKKIEERKSHNKI